MLDVYIYTQKYIWALDLTQESVYKYLFTPYYKAKSKTFFKDFARKAFLHNTYM